MKDVKFAVFNTDKSYGQMNANAAFYGEDVKPDERVKIMRDNKEKIAREVGFSIKRLFMTLQGKERGTSYTLTREDVASNKDLYDYDVYADIVKMTPETADLGTAIGFNVSGAANVIAMNTRTMEATSTFCAGAHINERVPEKIIEVLGGNPEDIYVDISQFDWIEPYYNPNDKNFTPAWMSNKEVWEGNYRRTESGILLVDLYTPLMEQLVNSGIHLSHITNRGDVYDNENYFSTQRSRIQNRSSQDGRYMHGVAYVSADKDYDQENIITYKKVK